MLVLIQQRRPNSDAVEYDSPVFFITGSCVVVVGNVVVILYSMPPSALLVLVAAVVVVVVVGEILVGIFFLCWQWPCYYCC